MPTIIDSLYKDTSQLLAVLAHDLSLQSFANCNLRKVLLLSTASFFEVRICKAVEHFAEVHSNGHPGIQSLIQRKAINRQYHTYFDWKEKKAQPSDEEPDAEEVGSDSDSDEKKKELDYARKKYKEFTQG